MADHRDIVEKVAESVMDGLRQVKERRCKCGERLQPLWFRQSLRFDLETKKMCDIFDTRCMNPACTIVTSIKHFLKGGAYDQMAAHFKENPPTYSHDEEGQKLDDRPQGE